MSLNTRRVSFRGSQGSRLDGRLELPDSRSIACAVFAHCFTCSKDYIAATRVSRALASRGIAVLRFDFTGLGGSEGDFAQTHFSDNVADLVCAAGYLREHHQAPKILIGHSLGGLAALVAAPQVPESAAIVTIAAPGEPAHVTQHFADKITEIEAHEETEVEIVGRPFRIGKRFLNDVRRYDMHNVMAALGDRALLVFHSPQDSIVDIEHAQRLLQLATGPKSFVLLDEADHLLTRRADAEYVADIVAAWVVRSMGDVGKRGAPHESSATGTVIVSEAGSGRLSQDISAGRHRLSADEPREHGGDDTGPTPYDLLLASLGSCTSMTIRMYAQRKGLRVDHVQVTLRHDKIHAEDCDNCETKEGRIDHIERVIEVHGDLDGDQLQRLLEIADKCPVHRTLQGDLRVQTRIQEDTEADLQR